VIIDDDAIALIERHRDGQHYFVFPGGGIESGETPEEAAIREVREELGIVIAIDRLVATMERRDETYLFYLGHQTGGTFGEGDGPEWHGAGRGEYTPQWIPLADLGHYPIRPAEIADLVEHAARHGWPSPAPHVQNDGRRSW
jgi:mutator protein MutT